MLEYKFQYNVPFEDIKGWSPVSMLNVTAYDTQSGIHIEFEKLGSATLICMKDWHKTIADLQALARTKFDQMLEVKEVQKQVA